MTLFQILLENGVHFVLWTFGALAFGFGRALYRDLRQVRETNERNRELLNELLEKRQERIEPQKPLLCHERQHGRCPHCDSFMMCYLGYGHETCMPLCARRDRCPGPKIVTNPDHPYR